MASIREKIKAILQLDSSPHHLALSFSVGVFFGISPLVGLHTILGLLAAWLFRFNRVVVLSGVYVTNPWSIVPIYTFCTWVGALLLGYDRVLPDVDWKHLSPGSLMNELGHLLMPFVVGSTVVALAAAGVGYVVVRHMAATMRRGRKEPAA
jgi:uncharacterized protein (DUF2062 family)